MIANMNEGIKKKFVQPKIIILDKISDQPNQSKINCTLMVLHASKTFQNESKNDH